jgi:hypothetical protein
VPEALEALINGHLSRTGHIAKLQELLGLLKKDIAATAVLKVHEPALQAFFGEAVARGSSVMSERAFLQQLNDAALMRGVIVPLPGAPKGVQVRCDLLWLDASAAFHTCASSEAGLVPADYAACLALCGMIKYRRVEPMSIVQQVAGFLANLAGRMDEVDVVKTSFSGASPRTRASEQQPAPSVVPAPQSGAEQQQQQRLAGAGASALEGLAIAAPAPAPAPAKARPASAPDAKAKRAPSPRGGRAPAPAAEKPKTPGSKAKGGAKAGAPATEKATPAAKPLKEPTTGAEAIMKVKAAQAFADSGDKPTGSSPAPSKGGRAPSPRGSRPGGAKGGASSAKKGK